MNYAMKTKKKIRDYLILFGASGALSFIFIWILVRFFSSCPLGADCSPIILEEIMKDFFIIWGIIFAILLGIYHLIKYLRKKK